MAISSISANEARQMLESIGMSLNSNGQVTGCELLDSHQVAPPATPAALITFSREIVGIIPSADWVLFQFNFSGPGSADTKFQIARLLFGPNASEECAIGPAVKFSSDDSRHRFILSDLVHLTLVEALDADLVWSSSLGKEIISLQDGWLYLSSRVVRVDMAALFGPNGSLGNWVSEFNRRHEDGYSA